jgi:glycogen debranching enzyme
MNGDLVSVLRGNTFVVSDARGDMAASPADPTGLFTYDTRFLSTWALSVNGERLSSLSVDDLQYYETRFFLVAGGGGAYVDAKLSVIRQRSVNDGFREDIAILNHDDEPVDLTVRIETACDFADLFEVKDTLAKKGTYYTRVEDGRLVLGYTRGTFHRQTVVSAATPAHLDDRGITFDVHIEPQREWSTQVQVVPTIIDFAGQQVPATAEALRRRAGLAIPSMADDLRD